MTSSAVSRKQWIILAVIFLLSLGYRASLLGTKPAPLATADEFGYLWLGLSLTEGRAPMTWSTLPVYEKSDKVLGDGVYLGRRFQPVAPGFDHPPLFSILAGAYARISGALQGMIPLKDASVPGEVYDVDLGKARGFALLLAGITMLLLFHLGRLVLGTETALGGVGCYGILATAVLHNNLVLNENLITPLFLLSVIGVQSYIMGTCSRRSFRTVMVVTTAAVTLCKIAASCQVLPLCLMLIMAGKKREMVYPVAGAVLGVLMFLAYGAWYDWSWFLAVQNAQAARFYGLNPWQLVLGTQRIVHRGMFSQMVLVGWIALMINLFKPHPKSALIAPFPYLLGYLFFANVGNLYGWHLLPYLPFVCLGLAWLVSELVRRPTMGGWYGAVVLLLPGAGEFVSENYLEAGGVIRHVYLAMVVAALLLPFVARRTFVKTVRFSLLGFLLLLAAREVSLVLRYE